MAQLTIAAGEVDLHRLVGTAVFLRGRAHVQQGEVLDVQWHPSGRAFGRVGCGGAEHSAIALVDRTPEGAVTSLGGSCTCRSGPGCPHAVALLLAGMPAAATPGGQTVRRPPSWERFLSPVVGAADPGKVEEQADVGLQFEVQDSSSRQAGRSPGARAVRIGLRPVLPGRTGGWVRTGISWSNLSYVRSSGSGVQARHLRLLREILKLAADTPGGYAYAYQQAATLWLESIHSRRLWDVLAEAREVGLPLVQAGKRAPAVIVSPGRAEVSLQVRRDPAGLELEPRIVAAGSPVVLGSSLLVGEPAHGIAWWQTPDEPEPRPADRVLRLAPLAGTVAPEVRVLLSAGSVRVPARDEERFLRDYYPALRQRMRVLPADGSVRLPQARPPVLAVAVDRLDGHRVAVSWGWVYALGDARRHEPLSAGPAARADRDPAAEAEILRRVIVTAQAVPGLVAGSPDGPRLVPAVTLSGMDTVRLLTGVLPVLEQMPDVEVAVGPDAAAPDYREATAAPVLRFGGDEAPAGDWFDLSVSVTVDGESVPFSDLFVALAHRQEWLLLPSGTYFSLDREEFHRLAALIEEARAMQDAPPGTVRLSRFQAGLWAELDRIGAVDGQAASWQESVRSLGSAAERSELAAPEGLRAALRPYQLAGFNWLATLFEHRLGGVLADDMGLGKTVQALALVCHARESGLAREPFLVVAPTSVVANWAAEAARFAPGLSVTAVTETRRRRGASLADAVAGADVVVTSYTLFRLEYADYEAVDWAGLVLDEAQFVKNHQSQSYQCVKRLPAPVKLAITGTPMENNLMELWSLLSVTAPGLFPSPGRFTDYYRTPIERDRDGERLAQLRRRVRPLMLRRTKEQVLPDLPDKQEQVIELELNPRHSRVYQTYLQRERQKVLGLLGDLAGNRFEIFRSLTLLRQASLDAALVDPKHSGIPSTKLDTMLEQVTGIVGEGHRTLVFSQFTRFLDAARRRLDAAGIRYCYLDGSTRNRAAIVAQFRAGAAPVFLISLKAGGFGLNLTEADYCILLDPWWNPATEAQAVDRVHRIGQTKKVMVYRLVAKDTIEQKVMALKAAKGALFDSVMRDAAFGSATLDAADIRGLLE
ncbi:MAG: SNF2-related protein [Mycobacteriales bacterium]